MSQPEVIEKDGKRYVLVWGQLFPEKMPPYMMHLWAWANYDKLKARGTAELSRYVHLKSGIVMVDEEMRTGWNDWTEMMCWAYAEYSYVTAMGCTASTKTHTFHKLGMYDFISSPFKTIMTCTTTNSAGLEQRMWPVVVSTFNRLKKNGGYNDWRTIVAPQKMLRPRDGETKHVIRAVTIEEKADEQAIVDQLIGVHCERRIWIVDEATSAPTSLDSAWANAMASTQHRRFVKLGNPMDEADALAISARPIAGWDSLDENTEKWEFEFYGEKGIGLHFHGAKSPNIKRGKVTRNGNKVERWPFMYDHDTYNAHLAMKETDPTAYHRFCVGWFCPEGISRRVLSWANIDKFKCKEHALFRGGDIQMFASLDPAFGGDRAMLYIWKKGFCITRNRIVMDCMDSFQIPIDPKGLPGEQIGRFVLEKARSFGFNYITIDTTTNNSACAEWLENNSSLKVEWVSFGGKASENPVSENDERLCKDVYWNHASELAFNVANYLPSICGLDQEACLEGASRFWENVGDKPTKKRIETKEDYKARMKRSPDRFDCVSLGVYGFIKLGGSKVAVNVNRSPEWNKYMSRKNKLLISSYR